jgi:hypothetical protein
VRLSYILGFLVAPSKVYGVLASGRPMAVVCPKHSYLKEMMAEIKCGGTFENGDSHGLVKFISHLYHDRQVAEKMCKAARLYMQSHFTQ